MYRETMVLLRENIGAWQNDVGMGGGGKANIKKWKGILKWICMDGALSIY
jgi:hypothetical protein